MYLDSNLCLKKINLEVLKANERKTMFCPNFLPKRLSGYRAYNEQNEFKPTFGPVLTEFD